MKRAKYRYRICYTDCDLTRSCGEGGNLTDLRKEITVFRKNEKRDTWYVIEKWMDIFNIYGELECKGKKSTQPPPFKRKKEEDWESIDRYASKFAGNWKKERDCSIWVFDDKDNPSAWGCHVQWTRDNRDCEKESNNAYILHALKNYRKGKNPTVFESRFTHWACGYIDVLCIQVYDKKGKYTKAFRIFAEIKEQMEKYGVLDEDDLSNREDQKGWEMLTGHMKFAVRLVKKRQQSVKALCLEFLDKYDRYPGEMYSEFPYEEIDAFVADKFSTST